MKQTKNLSVLDGIKKNGITRPLDLEAFTNLEPTKLDIAAVIGTTTNEMMKHELRKLSKKATMFDDYTPTMHLFQNLNDMPVSAGKWMLKGMLKENEYSLFFGKPGSRKSFLLIDMALHLSNGRDWAGMKTKIAPTVLYLVGEGQGGINLRLKAASQRHCLSHGKILVSKLPGALMDEESVQLIGRAIESIDGPVWLIVDTLHRNMGDGDENTSKDFGVILQNLDNNIKSLGATVSIVHHTGHSNTDRSRGSSSIQGALDSEFLVEKDDTQTNVICKKMKDAEFMETKSFSANVEVLGKDEDGDQITSLSMTETEQKFAIKLKEFEKEILLKIWTQKPEKSELKNEVIESNPKTSKKTLRTRVDRALDSLSQKGLIDEKNGVLSTMNSVDSLWTHLNLSPQPKMTKSEVDPLDSHTYRCESMSPTMVETVEVTRKATFTFDYEAAMRGDDFAKLYMEYVA